jgi:hypothetical protein
MIMHFADGDQLELLITPDTTLLYHGGNVKFIPGISGTL